MNSVDASMAKSNPAVSAILHPIQQAKTNSGEVGQADLVRDLLEMLLETKRKENPFGLRSALNDLSTLEKKFESLKHGSERKSDLLRKVIANLVPGSSKKLLNSVSKLLCDHYKTND